jgi:hypothetical protein
VGNNIRSSNTRLRTNEVVEATAISTMDGTPRHQWIRLDLHLGATIRPRHADFWADVRTLILIGWVTLGADDNPTDTRNFSGKSCA